MSRDTKASCTDCQGHADAAAVPFASPFPVYAKRDELNEPERSVRPVSSFVATTCASDTDDGDYETSSEGMVLSKRSGIEIHGAQAKESLCAYLKEKSASLGKCAAFDGNIPTIKKDIISDPPHELMENRLIQKTTYVRDSLILISENLAQSKSLPILKSKLSSGVSTDYTTADVALMSASSSARKRKMSMVIKRMAPFISPYPSTVSLMTGATTNFWSQRYEPRRLVSRTKLPILCDATPTTVINDGRSEELVAEVTLHETRNNHRAMNWDLRQDAIPSFVNDEGAANLTNDGDLVDIARNPYSSIKSVYFPPNLSDSPALPEDKSRIHQRVSNDVEALLKIDYELGPLRYQYSEIIGKARALALSDMGFDFGISCRLDRSDTFSQSMLSPNASNYLPDHDQTYMRRAATNCSIKNRPALVDKISPSSTFSMVGKQTPRGSRTSWLNENGSNRRQEALSFAICNPSRTLESFDGFRSSSRVRNSISYFPTTNSHAFQAESVLDDRFRNGCVSNNSFQLYRKPKAVIERATSAWDGWFVRGTANTNSSSVLNRTEYNSHRYLNQTVEDSQTSTNNFVEVRRQKSSVSIVEVIDNNWPTMDEGAANKRSNEDIEVLSGDQNSVESSNCGSNYHKSVPTETERVIKDDRISSPFALKSIDHGVDSDCRTLRTISASACASQIRVVNVNTEFRTTVEKRYTSRAVSPIQHSAIASSTMTSPSNVLLAATVSSIFVQQVRADSSREAANIKSPTKICSIDVNERDVLAGASSKRDFCVQKVDYRPAAENLSRLPESKKEIDLTTTEFRKARYLRLPRGKEKITIVPIVLTDGISDSSRTADVDFAIPRYVDKTVPKLNYQIAPLDARKFRGTSLSSIRDKERSRRGIADPVCLKEFVDEKRWRTSRTFVSHDNCNLYAEKDYPSSTTVAGNPKRSVRVATSNARVVRKTREYRESARQRVAKTIPGMRSTPEDFLCET